MSELWIDWSTYEKISTNNELVFFGASELAEKTLNKSIKKPIYFIDNNKKKQGTIFHDIDIISPYDLEKINEDYVIIVNILAEHEEIEKQLNELGFKGGKDYFYTPVLKNHKIDSDIKQIDQKLLFTSSVTPQEHDEYGGGLYEYDLITRNIRKIHSGRFCQMKYFDERLFVIDHYDGVKVFDKTLKLIDTYDILEWSTPHGIAIDKENEIIFVANTGLDSISLIDINSGEHIEEINIDSKMNRDIYDKHHINDLKFKNGYLLVSMFSFSGMWNNGCYDGGVAKLNTKTKKIEGYPVKDMWMPHSIDFIGNELVFIDSMRGDVYKTNNKKITNISGFVRGLDYDGKYYYIGQSEHRYFDRLKDVSDNIHINCGIHIFDAKTKASRFHQLDQYISNIHSIMVKNF